MPKAKLKPGKKGFKSFTLGNLKREGLDYDLTFSPVIDFNIVKLFMILFICMFKWVTCLLDGKCANLYGYMNKEVYTRQLDGYKIKKVKKIICLNSTRNFYSLHKAGRCWHHDFRDRYLKMVSNKLRGSHVSLVIKIKQSFS